MNNLVLFATALLFLNTQFLTAQCDFPQSTHINQHDNAIIYDGVVRQVTTATGTTVFSINPSQLSFQADPITGDAFPTSSDGVWLIKWNYSAQPNRWQTLPADCSATSVTFKSISGEPIRKGWLEVDFFYYDETLEVSATFEGTILYEIKDLKKGLTKLQASNSVSIF